MRKLSFVLTVLLSVLLAFVACDNSVDIGLNTKVEVKEILLNETELDISTGDEKTLVATVLPEDATDKSVTWSSSDPKVAKVDANGKVTGVGAGEATITVTSNSDKTVTETCSVKVAVNPYKTPLTLEFLNIVNIGHFSIVFDGEYGFGSVFYSKNGEDRLEIKNGDSIPVSAGDKICFYRDYEVAKAIPAPIKIVCDSECYVYGNVMSLIDSDGFAEATEVPSGSLVGLFAGNTCIKNHDTYDLVLPATTLGSNCYAFMFYNCAGLTRAPELPADTLADSCYRYMFYGCTSLTSITCLATNISAENCTSKWVEGVADDGIFTRALGIPIASAWSSKGEYCGIPSDWDVVPPMPT